jgi:hypothetical protein
VFAIRGRVEAAAWPCLARKIGRRPSAAGIGKEKSMRFARRLVLLAVAAIATMALMASSAQALEIATESNGVHCVPVTPNNAEPFITTGTGGGGCLYRAHSIGTVELSSFGQMVECNMVLEGRINELGEGYIYSVSFTGCTPFAVVPCTINGVMENWIVHWNAEVGANVKEVRLCVVALGVTIRCHLFLNVSENPLHRYPFNTGGVHRFCEGNMVSIRGSWEQEVDAAHPAIEVRG